MYFPNFFGFRILAAIAVVILHIQLMSERFGWENSRICSDFELLSLGVDFFFVVSGFLITAIIVEAVEKRTFKLGRYYRKRALRILPLYFLVILIVFFAAPLNEGLKINSMPIYPHFEEQLLLHLLLLPQVAKSYLPFIPYGGQVWSIGVEVMFYLVWPLLLLWKRSLRFLVLFAGFNIALKGVAFLSLGSEHPLCTFLAMSRFEVLATGGVAFIWWRQVTARDSPLGQPLNKLMLRVAMRPSLAWSAIISGAAVTFVTWRVVPNLVHVVSGIWFSILLIFSVTGALKLSFLELPIVRYLGEISYGIYLWHFLAIGIIKLIVETMDLTTETPGFWLFVYSGSLAVTFAMSIASYEILEKPVNRFRKRL